MDGPGRWTLATAVAGSGMVFLDATVVTVALPRIGLELPSNWMGTLEAQAYVYNAYLLGLGSLLVLGGALADVYGRRRLYVIGLVAFAGASLLCGLAPTMEFLLAARLLQGAAGAILVPGSLAIITTRFEGEERGRAFGTWAGASAVTTILGPLVGGLLVDMVSWRAVFLLNLPIAAFGLVAAVRHLEESRDEAARGRIDTVGSLVVALAVGGLTLGAIRGQERAWQDPFAFLALGVGLVAAAAFVPLMSRSPRPLVPLALFRARNFAVANASTVAIYGAMSVTMYFLVLFLQGVRGYNASAAGLATVPTVLFLALFSTRFGTLAARHGPRRYMAAGPALMALGAALLVRVPANGAAWAIDLSRLETLRPPDDYVTTLLPGLVVFGLGIMVVVAPLTTALMDALPPARSGVGSAVNNALARVGPQIALAVLFVAATATFDTHLGVRLDGMGIPADGVVDGLAPLNPPPADAPPAVREAAVVASTASFHLAMIAAAALAGVGALINGLGIRDPATPPTPRRPAECLPGSTPP
jgi:EmrB/QacA subfamily drug resistance transporter